MSDRIESAVTEQEDAGQGAGEEQAQVEQEAQAEASTESPSAVASQETPEAEQTETPTEVPTEPAEASSESAEATQPVAEQAEEPGAEADAVPEASAEAAQTEILTEAAEESAESTEAAQPVAEQAEEPVAEADAALEASIETETQAEDAAAGDDAGDGEDAEEIETEEVVMPDGSKRMVRVLAVGQQVTGTVKRIADFGAFVDIGVGRDGLIHISELSVRRVGKVTDVLGEGQEVTAWIKKLDRERNRISLTLIDPDTKTIRDLKKGEVVSGTVTRILPYGAFIDIGIGRDALLHVREMAEGYVAKPEDVVKVGEELEARVIELSRRRGRVDLSLKGLRPEPEAAQPVVQDAPEVADDDDFDDQFEDVEVLSPMEMAFKLAMEAEGMEVKPKKKKGRGRRGGNRSIQDEIIERTLSNR